MAKAQLQITCASICTPGKGITACDEGPGTIGGRFEKVGVENTEENRRAYRQMLFEAPGASEHLSAAILDPETMYQKNDAGVLFPEALAKLGIVPGVKPHLKVYKLPGTGGETVMQGLDSLAARCKEYKAAGAKFAKWRSPLVITESAPSDLAIEANMRDLARYALICQDEGLVPIVEPDVVMQGTHDLETAIAVNVKVQATLYKAMLDHGVFMEGTILKTNMVNPGLDCPVSYTAEEIAEANITTLRRVMPVAIPGVNFLSGGQNLEDAAARLNAINRTKGNSPWNLSFSWSAALQMPLFELCKGKGGKMPLEEMSALYVKELQVASAAALGKHTPGPEEGAHVAKQLVAA
uniref:fructose-bisphosphate aldolase n=1 Tax=Zooxanthella nutricula TaxID=1333877 RepID=A0A7S2HMU7_9DINO